MVLLSDAAEKRLLSVGEAAQYFGVQERTIYSWASQETIPSVHISVVFFSTKRNWIG